MPFCVATTKPMSSTSTPGVLKSRYSPPVLSAEAACDKRRRRCADAAGAAPQPLSNLTYLVTV